MSVFSEKPVGSRAQRLTSFDLADFPVPGGKEEEWRFTPLDRMAPLFEPVAAGETALHEEAATDFHDCHQLELDVVLAPQVHGEVVGMADARLGRAGAPGDRAAAASWVGARHALAVTIPAGTCQTEPSHVTVNGRGDGHPSVVNLLFEAQPAASGVVVLDHIGAAAVNESVEIVVGAGADLTVISIQDWESGSVHASSQRAVLGEDARLTHLVATVGGDVVRVTTDVGLAAAGAEVRLNGLYFADAHQHLEHRLFVDHASADCKSRVTYKGALQGAGARAVWVGDVLIRAQAVGTDTYELNRNLLLTSGTRADSVPNLEIETGEIVGAGHASATGRFDDEQLFYLMSRGIPHDQAQRLVVRGFFAELIEPIAIGSVRGRLLAAIERELA